MTHDKQCPMYQFVYEIGSGQDIPDCNCKMDYKSALDWFKLRFGDFKQEVESGNRGAKGWEKTWSLIQTTINALTIAAEYERVKKEREKLADILEDILHSAFEHGSKNLSGKTLDPDGEMLWRAKQLVEKIRGI